ncbi:MAG: 50S ribosomal protein L13 [Deltaproteobacteria bacterium]|jgi:large subunit ribosomal protein L13|nr:50S ribosomal protein L13 [Deltaproteobacteria bacterium]
MKTYNAKPGEVERKWVLLDAQDQVLGRLATKAATLLMGKHKPEYTPHVDTGEFVVVVNAAGVKLTGRKLDQKTYYRHTGYPGGIRSRSAREVLEKRPEWMIREAVKGMLPKNILGRQLITKLKVYADGQHPHAAQKPAAITVD